MVLMAGLDETGMGALAGPLVIVVLAFDDQKSPLVGVNDSKKVSKNKRIKLFDRIVQYADFLGFGHSSASEIDQFGIAEAWQLAANKALTRHPHFERLLIDGTRSVRDYMGRQSTIIRGDSLHWQISAASIVAKVLRDREMEELGNTSPGYQWEKNAGYGVQSHYTAIQEHGFHRQHRRTFLKKLM